MFKYISILLVMITTSVCLADGKVTECYGRVVFPLDLRANGITQEIIKNVVEKTHARVILVDSNVKENKASKDWPFSQTVLFKYVGDEEEQIVRETVSAIAETEIPAVYGIESMKYNNGHPLSIQGQLVGCTTINLK